MFVADLIENEGELLDRRDDDLLAGLDEPSQVAGTLGVSHRRAHLGVFPDRVSDLPVEDAAVGDDDDRVEDRSVVLFQPDQLVGQPCDRKALPAARRVLDQITLPRAAGSRVGQELAHRVDLVIARPDLDSPLLPCLGVLRFHDLGVVLQDVGQAPAGQHLAPQVVRPQAVGVGRVSRTVVPTPVEGQEPGGLSLEMGAEMDLVLVHREVGRATAELEELLARVAVLPVLLHGVAHRLLGEAVLEFEGEDRKTVDEESDVECALGAVPAVAELTGDGEAILPEALLGLLVLGRGGSVEQVEFVRTVPDAVSEDVDGAAFGDLALQPGKEPAASGAVFGQSQGRGGFGLGGVQEGAELNQVDAVLTVVVAVVAAGPAYAAVPGGRVADGAIGRRVAGIAGQALTDQAFEAAFGCVRSHM